MPVGLCGGEGGEQFRIVQQGELLPLGHVLSGAHVKLLQPRVNVGGEGHDCSAHSCAHRGDAAKGPFHQEDDNQRGDAQKDDAGHDDFAQPGAPLPRFLVIFRDALHAVVLEVLFVLSHAPHGRQRARPRRVSAKSVGG